MIGSMSGVLTLRVPRLVWRECLSLDDYERWAGLCGDANTHRAGTPFGVGYEIDYAHPRGLEIEPTDGQEVADRLIAESGVLPGHGDYWSAELLDGYGAPIADVISGVSLDAAKTACEVDFAMRLREAAGLPARNLSPAEFDTYCGHLITVHGAIAR